MTIGVTGAESRRVTLTGADLDLLRALSIAAGLGWALLFPLFGVRYELQTYGDGALFSYAVAAQDVWAFHWHNISGRLFVYLAALLPAESYVGLTGDAHGGIAAYGLLFFAAPLVGLLATFALDRSPRRILSVFACASTACVCPLVFGFPTEMWMAHAVFWPALAACHDARKSFARFALILALLLALVLSHEGALIAAAAIVAITSLRGIASPAFRRTALAACIALAVWAGVKLSLPPDAYIADVLENLALNVFDVSLLSGHLVLLLFFALTGYAILFHLLARRNLRGPAIVAFCVLALILSVHWMWFDQSLHAEDRYYLRTAVIVLTPIIGVLAAVFALDASGFDPVSSLVRQLIATLGAIVPVRAAAGMLLLVTTVHAVETAKFVAAWTDYRHAMRSLAAGPASDPQLGDTQFVSAERLGPAQVRLGWASTAPFLSVLVTPDLSPARLVVAPEADFFWISCETATANLEAQKAIPHAARDLIRSYSCLHRPDDVPASGAKSMSR